MFSYVINGSSSNNNNSNNCSSNFNTGNFVPAYILQTPSQASVPSAAVPLQPTGAPFVQPPIFQPSFLPASQSNKVYFLQNGMLCEVPTVSAIASAQPYQSVNTAAAFQQVPATSFGTNVIATGNLAGQPWSSQASTGLITQLSETSSSEVHESQSSPNEVKEQAEEEDINDESQQQAISDNTEEDSNQTMPTPPEAQAHSAAECDDDIASNGSNNDENNNNSNNLIDNNFTPIDMAETSSQPCALVTTSALPEESQSAVEPSLNDENRGSNEINAPLIENEESSQPENSITTTADMNQFDGHNNEGSNGDVLFVDNDNDEEEDVKPNLADLRQNNTPTNSAVLPSILHCQHCPTLFTSFADLRLHTRIAHIYTKPFLCIFPTCTELPFFTFEQAEEHIQRQHMKQPAMKISKKFVRTYFELIYREDEELKKWLTSDEHRSLEASADLPEDNNHSNVTAGATEMAEASDELMPAAAVAFSSSSSQSVQTAATQSEEKHFQKDALSAVEDTCSADPAAIAATYTVISDNVSTSLLEGLSQSTSSTSKPKRSTKQNKKQQIKVLKSTSTVQNIESVLTSISTAVSEPATVANPDNIGQNTRSANNLKRHAKEDQKTPIKKLKGTCTVQTDGQLTASTSNSSSTSDQLVIALYNSTKKYSNSKSNSNIRYVCQRPACGLRFKALAFLKAHDRKHREGSELYRCLYEGCNQTASLKGNLMTHIHNWHTGKKRPKFNRHYLAQFIEVNSDGLKVEKELWDEAQERAVLLVNPAEKSKGDKGHNDKTEALPIFALRLQNQRYYFNCRQPSCECSGKEEFNNLTDLAAHFEQSKKLKCIKDAANKSKLQCSEKNRKSVKTSITAFGLPFQISPPVTVLFSNNIQQSMKPYLCQSIFPSFFSSNCTYAASNMIDALKHFFNVHFANRNKTAVKRNLKTQLSKIGLGRGGLKKNEITSKILDVAAANTAITTPDLATTSTSTASILRTPFKQVTCKLCGKGKFKSFKEYREHDRTHTNLKPYRCSVEGCKKNFTQKGGAYSHFRQQHQKQHQKDHSLKNVLSENCIEEDAEKLKEEETRLLESIIQNEVK